MKKERQSIINFLEQKDSSLPALGKVIELPLVSCNVDRFTIKTYFPAVNLPVRLNISVFKNKNIKLPAVM